MVVHRSSQNRPVKGFFLFVCFLIGFNPIQTIEALGDLQPVSSTITSPNLLTLLLLSLHLRGPVTSFMVQS